MLLQRQAHRILEQVFYLNKKKLTHLYKEKSFYGACLLALAMKYPKFYENVEFLIKGKKKHLSREYLKKKNTFRRSST